MWKKKFFFTEKKKKIMITHVYLIFYIPTLKNLIPDVKNTRVFEASYRKNKIKYINWICMFYLTCKNFFACVDLSSFLFIYWKYTIKKIVFVLHTQIFQQVNLSNNLHRKIYIYANCMNKIFFFSSPTIFIS